MRITLKKLTFAAYFPKKYAPVNLPTKENTSQPNKNVLKVLVRGIDPSPICLLT